MYIAVVDTCRCRRTALPQTRHKRVRRQQVLLHNHNFYNYIDVRYYWLNDGL